MRYKAHNDKSQLNLMFPDTSQTFADFFCGCGGLSLGFIQAGFKCLSAMDIMPEAVGTYWRNLCYKGWSHLYVPENTSAAQMKKYAKCFGKGETGNRMFDNGIPDNWLSVKEPMPCLNLFLWSILDLEPEEWMDIIGVRPGDIRVFVGGPPCQGFSTANNTRGEYDERNELPIRYIHYAKVCKPDIVFMENVPGLLSLGKKKGDEDGPFVKWIREAFNEAGYDMEYEVHNAMDYGVPQSRKRVIFMAYRKSCKIPHVKFEKMHGKGLLPYVTTREAIGDMPPIQAGEQWGLKGKNSIIHPYGYNKEDGYVICPVCLKYNLNERTNCHHCDHDLSEPIRGGVLKIPGIGTLRDTQVEIDNNELREQYIIERC